ncbi:WG repeat-containing protein [Shiella aurantiaca]|nr:WG repeat-containing protein [Shiella aurantiaca]
MSFRKALLFGFLLILPQLLWSQTYTLFAEKGKVGVRSGQEVSIPARYDNIGWSNQSFQWVGEIVGYQLNGLWGLLNKEGEILSPPIYSGLQALPNQTVIFWENIRAHRTQKYGLMDGEGKILIPNTYAYLHFAAPYYIASQKSGSKMLQGLLDPSGKSILPITYPAIQALSSELLEITQADGLKNLYSTSQKQFVSAFQWESFQPFHDFFIGYKQGWGYVFTAQGNQLNTSGFSDIRLQDGKLQIKTQPQWEIIGLDNTPKQRLAFEEIKIVSQGVFWARTHTAQWLISPSGNTLFGPYEQLVPTSNDWALFKQNGKWGMANFFGNVFLPAEYDSLYADELYIYLFQKTGFDKGWQVLNYKKEPIAHESFDYIERSTEGMIKVERKGKWGFINKSTRTVIPCLYDRVADYQYNQCVVEYHGREGVIDKKGYWILLPEYLTIHPLTPSIYLTKYPSGISSIRDTATVYYETANKISLHGALLLERNSENRFGLNSWLGKPIAPVQFDFISDEINDSLLVVRQGQQWGAIYRNGKWALPLSARYDTIAGYNEGLFRVVIDGSYGFVNKAGQLRIANRYENAQDFSEGMAAIRILGKWGYINAQERLIIQPQFEEVGSFRQGLAEVKRKGKTGIINTKGELLLPTEFDSLEKVDTEYYITQKNGKYGLMSTQGVILQTEKFETMRALPNHLFLIQRNGKWGTLNAQGLSTLPLIYDTLMLDEANQVFIGCIQGNWQSLL